MKAVMISIQPKWCELIASGKKTVEVRKTRPKIETPFKVYIYETLGKKEKLGFVSYVYEGQGKVIGEFVCKKVDRIAHCGTCNNDIRLRIVDENICFKELDYEYLTKCKLHYPEIDEYSNGGDVYGWHISDFVLYDKPKELGEFAAFCEGLKPYQCDKCEYSYTESNESIGTYHGCGCDNLKPLKRPPQSWCYVEERREK